MIRFMLAVCLSVFVSLAEGAEPPTTYSGAAFGGRIVDGETGQPLEGAAVVARWQLYRAHNFMNIVGSTEYRVLHVAESVTDAGGFYRIPAWGPIVRPAGWEIEGEEAPLVMAFKPGYGPDSMANGIWVSPEGYYRDRYQGFNPRDAEIRRSQNDGKDIALYKYGRRPEEPTGVIDPSVKRTPEMKIREKVNNFAFYLEDNVDNADEEERGDSPKKLEAIRAQRQAILMVEQELQRLYAPQRYTSQLGIILQEIVREEQRKRGDKSPNLTPQPLPRQTPPPQMYGPPPGFVAPNNQRNGQ